MRAFRRLAAAAAMLLCAGVPSFAVEGASTAGPIGGTDIRSALLPPPGLYGGIVGLYATGRKFYDGSGRPIPKMNSLALARYRAGPFLAYVPDLRLLGGSIGFGGILPMGKDCGHILASTPTECVSGFGDPYLQIGWSRFFGTMRSSRYAGAFPVPEGLTVALGFGMVVPIGHYNATDAAMYGVTVGNNLWDFAPTIAVTYVTPPLIGDGTEISARVYLNNYLTNSITDYTTGSVLDIDFAVSERFGRVQLGVAGYWAHQLTDDLRAGVPVAPDGHRAEAVTLGPIIAFDMPEIGGTLKIKGLKTILTKNTVGAYGVAVTFAKALWAPRLH